MGKYETYIVKSGDCLLSIAEKLKLDYKKIAMLNKLSEYDNFKIKIGQELKLPIIIKKNELYKMLKYCEN